jgi:hypothetical protein
MGSNKNLLFFYFSQRNLKKKVQSTTRLAEKDHHLLLDGVTIYTAYEQTVQHK